MAKSVFYSFHYDLDVRRVQQIRNIGALDGNAPVSPQDWEKVKQGGDAAIERWIDEQMSYKRAVVVLIGAETASRPWVQYEITRAWKIRKPLVGIRIHGLKDPVTGTTYAGADPFATVKLQNGKTIADYISPKNPAGQDSKQVYATIGANLAAWVDGAYVRP
ncbi:TIR domain-containing protein [Oerskovia paurometabola]|uniref:TIR domain-containing protein n=1 Tax=Oerskovia paurometabola TaxID=162170 RepID=UPI00381BD8C1